MDLIQAIRREYGLDIVISDVQASSAVQNLSQNLENACRRYAIIELSSAKTNEKSPASAKTCIHEQLISS